MNIKHLDRLAHIFLVLAFAVGALVIWRLRFESRSQFVVILVLVCFYLLWGLVYHHLRQDFSRKLFLEYLLIAAIALVAGFLVFVR